MKAHRVHKSAKKKNPAVAQPQSTGATESAQPQPGKPSASNEPAAQAQPQPIRCIFLNLDNQQIHFEPEGIQVITAQTAEEVQKLAEAQGASPCAIVLGVSRNLMNNYLAIASLFFNPFSERIPIILVTHSSNKIPDYKAFLFGKRPYPVHRMTAATIQEMLEIKQFNTRTFHRIPVEFIAFADPGDDKESIPVVCRNISWGGTYFETRDEINFREFKLILRSRLHRIEIRSYITWRKTVTAQPPCFGYGVRFLRPLPLSLVHYMYAKYLKDRHGVV